MPLNTSDRNLDTTKQRRQPRRVLWSWLTSVTLCCFISGGVLGFASEPSVLFFAWGVATVGLVWFGIALGMVWMFISALVTIDWARVKVSDVLSAGVFFVFLAGLTVLAFILLMASLIPGAWAWIVGLPGAWIWAVPGAWVVPIAWAVVNREIRVTLNRWQPFLGVCGVSVAGLGLGWAIGAAVRSSGLLPIAML
jgi:hypothetical protein